MCPTERPPWRAPKGIERLDFGEDRAADVVAVFSEEGDRIPVGRIKLRMHVEETLEAGLIWGSAS